MFSSLFSCYFANVHHASMLTRLHSLYHSYPVLQFTFLLFSVIFVDIRQMSQNND